MSTTALIFLLTLVSIPFVSLGQITETKLTPSDEAVEFGSSASISGDYAIVGAWASEKLAGPGSAYIFARDGLTWVEKAKLRASDPSELDLFGASASISGDFAVVGKYGGAYVFRREDTNWVDDIKLTSGLFADWFGYSVSISGDYIIVGAYADLGGTGAAYIFKHEGTSWVQKAKLRASDGATQDLFGRAVSLSGNYAIITSDWDDDKGTNSGSAYVFRREDTSWVEEAKITASDGAAFDDFGYSVSISGDEVVLGAPLDDDNGTNSGSAFVFRREGTKWVEEMKLTASDGAAYDYFGHAVSISGDYAVISAVDDYQYGRDSGSVYIFRHVGTTWVQEAKLFPSDGTSNSKFGYSVSIDGDYTVVGAEGVWAAYVYSGFTTTPCSDYTNFLTRCVSGSTVKARVVLMDNISHSGETVLFQVDSTTYPTTIVDNGTSSRASISIPGLGSGPHTVSVIDPAGCFDPRTVRCAAGLEISDQEWEADDARWSAETGRTETPPTPASTELLGNYPNPFNPSTTIRYELPENTWVTLRIYNSIGQEVRTLVNEFQSAGFRSITWNGKNESGDDVSSGMYFYTLRVGQTVKMEKVMLVR